MIVFWHECGCCGLVLRRAPGGCRAWVVNREKRLALQRKSQGLRRVPRDSGEGLARRGAAGWKEGVSCREVRRSCRKSDVVWGESGSVCGEMRKTRQVSAGSHPVLVVVPQEIASARAVADFPPGSGRNPAGNAHCLAENGVRPPGVGCFPREFWTSKSRERPGVRQSRAALG